MVKLGVKKLIKKITRKLRGRKSRSAALKHSKFDNAHLSESRSHTADVEHSHTLETGQSSALHNDQSDMDVIVTPMPLPVADVNRWAQLSGLSEIDIGEQLWVLWPETEQSNILRQLPESFFTLNSVDVVTEAPCDWKLDLQGEGLVKLTNLSWSPSMIWGRIQVANICYEKNISVRLTANNWTMYEDYPATFEASAPDRSKDSFALEIPFPDDSKCIEFAVQYSYDEQEAWDNNCGVNYKITCNYN